MNPTKTLIKLLNTAPLTSAFIYQGVCEYVDKILNNQDVLKEKMKNGFIRPDAWIAMAHIINKELGNPVTIDDKTKQEDENIPKPD